MPTAAPGRGCAAWYGAGEVRRGKYGDLQADGAADELLVFNPPAALVCFSVL